MNKLGTYTYKHPMYKHSSRAYQKFEMRVRVVDEKANKYRVQYLGFHASGAAVNSLHWVRKDKVKLDEPLADTTPARLPVDVRLPYKDD